MALERIYIEKVLEKSTLIQTLLSRIGREVSIEWLSDVRGLLDDSYQKGSPGAEKKELLIYSFPGRFLSGCPGSDGMICCHYYVINTGMGCPMGCHYCFLQAYQNRPLMTLHGNLDDLFKEIVQMVSDKKYHFRIGSGEFSDSLALDHLCSYSSHLVEFFAGLSNATLELKTKTAHLEELLGLEHRNRTVLAWSMNPERIINEIEPGAAHLEERIAAARQAGQAGYRLAFHFDPVVFYKDWEIEYHEVIDRLFSVVDPSQVAWISMGTFRANRILKENMENIYPEEWLTRAEMVQASDGKYRYFKTIRQEIYRSLLKRLKMHSPDIFVYLCMETQPMWDRVFGFVPKSAKNLDQLFERRRLEMEKIGV